MSIKDVIMADIKTAMKEKNQDKLSVLRFLSSAIKNREIELRPNEITEQDIIGVIKKSIKQRKESIEQFQNAGRQDLADKEAAELKVLEVYLPQQMSREQIETVVAQVLTELNITSVKEMGRAMKEVVARTAGQADNKIVSEIVKSKLQ